MKRIPKPEPEFKSTPLTKHEAGITSSQHNHDFYMIERMRQELKLVEQGRRFAIFEHRNPLRSPETHKPLKRQPRLRYQLYLSQEGKKTTYWILIHGHYVPLKYFK